MVKTEDKIISYIKSKGQATPFELSQYLDINRAATHRQIKKLMSQSIIYKIGKSPKVFYALLGEKKDITPKIVFDKKQK